jgi:hypothetical protein
LPGAERARLCLLFRHHYSAAHSRIDQNLTHDLTTLLATLINNGSVRKMYVLAPHQKAPHIHACCWEIVWQRNSHHCSEIYLRSLFFTEVKAVREVLSVPLRQFVEKR